MTAAAKRRRPPLRINRKSHKRPEHAIPTRTPLHAVICVLDSAKTTGHATYVDGRLHHYGEVNARVTAQRLLVLRDAQAAAYMRQVPCGLVIEVPWGGYQSTAISLAETAALWRDSWRSLGLSDEHVLIRTAGDWRRAVFGSARLPRDQARLYESQLAQQVVMRDHPHGGLGLPIGDDAAAAICIGQVFVRSRELQTLLGCACV